MSSGQYSALSGALGRMAFLDTISDNLSNTNTVGFKKGSAVFEAQLQQAQADRRTRGINFTDLQGGFTDYKQGMLAQSGSPLHLGIEGEGFFKIENPETDTIFYTRQGNFQLSPAGEVVTSDGHRLLGDDGRPIVLPTPDVEIDQDGMIKVPGGEPKRLPLWRFADDAVLQRAGSGRFVVSSDHKEQLVAEPRVYQNRLEQSNVNMMIEMTRMMDALRSFEALQKTLHTYNELAKKANDIGTIG